MKASRWATLAIAFACSFALVFALGCSGAGAGSKVARKAPSHKQSRGLTLVVDEKTGDMEITRPESGTRSLSTGTFAEEGKNAWTIFVFLCGSDLESDGGAASVDLEEMQTATSGSNVRFVVEAGGATSWQAQGLSAKKANRFVIEDGEIKSAQSPELRNMGASDTLADFLIWGTTAYPSEHAGVIVWDHGGGSIAGVCLDENYDGDSLTLKELDAALLSVYGVMDAKFDFIGFDACLMGTLETANILASYADYMYASEEMEPGDGWDYRAIAGYLDENPQTTAADLGRVVCDSYYEACDKDVSDMVTLSVVDLSKIDDVVKNFNTFSQDLCNAAGSSSNLANIVRGVYNADNYGGNNRSEGYTNMVDLLGIVDACERYVPSGNEVRKALEAAVVYNKTGSDHKTAGGLSVYYPLMVQDSDELAMFQQVCVSPYYLTFVDTVERTSAQDATDAVFDLNSWFDDGEWEWSSAYDYNYDTGLFGFDFDVLDEEYWSFENESQETGQSPLISFSQKPDYDKDGSYNFVLSDKAREYAVSVSAYVFEVWGDEAIELGETCDVYGDWETGAFHDDFDGSWISLPDGQNLATYVAEWTDDYIVYTSPIRLNGEVTSLRMKQSFDSWDIVVEGAWDGIDENGMAARDIRKIVKGDKIVPLYFSYDNDTDDPDVEGESYKVKDDFKVGYDQLQGNEYEYSFIIEDVYGDYYMTDPARFSIEDGDIMYW